jgi:hypothetical protein
MPGLSKVIVLDPDARASRQLQLGFEREGIPAAAVAPDLAADASPLELPGKDTGLVVVGGADGQAVELIRRARGWLDDHVIDAPIVFAGRGVTPDDAEAAGADEVVRHPAYLRDVVTIGRLLRGAPSGHRDHIVGSLVDVTGVYTLVRALSALGRSATLTLVRGLRRGEVRFYLGEVTSAQVGLNHGQAALHQLMLWTDARFDYHHEDIVRRQQIPLSSDELFADAERFLESVRASSGGLSPGMVLEQDIGRVQSFSKQIPTEVYGVLRMFDGHRALADVLEDSAYRVFETLRVAQRAVEAGLLRIGERQPRRPSWRAVLGIEAWLAGPPGATAPSEPATRDSGAITVRGPQSQATLDKATRKRRKKKKRADTPVAVPVSAPAARDIDWGALVPRIVGAEVGPLAGVVPASHVSGEIVSARGAADAAAGPGGADLAAPAADAEPTVVFDEAAERADVERAAADRAAAERAEAERAAAERAAAERAAAERVAAERAEAERAAAERAEAERAAAERAAAERAEAEWAAAKARTRAETERAEAERAAAKASTGASRADAIRAVAATVSVSSEPAPVLDDVELGEPRRERRPPATAGGPAEHAEHAEHAEPALLTGAGVVQDGMVVAASDAITAPIPGALDAAPATDAAPDEIEDEPSDGVVRDRIATAETAPVRRRPASDLPLDDRPGDMTGEITMPRARPTIPTRHSEPSILVADLAEAHAAVSAIADEQATAPTTVDAASPALEAEVAEARTAAATLSDVEEAFFRGGRDDSGPTALPAPESFDDLDKDYRPRGFWQRLRRRLPSQSGAPEDPEKK